MEETNNSQQLKTLQNSQIRKDFMIISSFVYTLTKQSSKTDEEFDIKYDVYEKLQRSHNNWGRGCQIATVGGMITYFLRGNSPKLKLLTGFLYTYWFNHIYTLGTYGGLVLYLPGQFNKLNLGNQYETGRYMQNFIGQIQERQELEQKGEKVKSDRQLLNEFYKSLVPDKEKKKFNDDKSYVQNDFYAKNRHLFTKQGDDDTNPSHFLTDQSKRDDDSIKLKYFDSFLTRYVYHSFTRWGTRVGQKFGFIEEH